MEELELNTCSPVQGRLCPVVSFVMNIRVLEMSRIYLVTERKFDLWERICFLEFAILTYGLLKDALFISARL